MDLQLYSWWDGIVDLWENYVENTQRGIEDNKVDKTLQYTVLRGNPKWGKPREQRVHYNLQTGEIYKRR